jgi:hypothetical protein
MVNRPHSPHLVAEVAATSRVLEVSTGTFGNA